MSTPEEISIDCGYLRLAAKRWGGPSGRPVLALHGWLDNAATFDHLAPLLRGVQLIALDLPGHGYSDHRSRGSHYHFVDFVADVINAAGALELERFALLGHSLGAAIASVAAGVVPDRVSHLALIEGLGPFTRNAADAPAQLLQSIEEMNALTAKSMPVYVSVEQAARARCQAGDLGEAAALTLAHRGTSAHADGYTWRADPQLRVKSPYYLSEKQVVACLNAVSAPSLLIRASDGLVAEYPHMQARISTIGGLQLHDLSGGHHLHLEKPQPVADVLNAFLAD